MRVLIVVGGCLRVNSSANLCHRAYIEGFIDDAHEVTVISMSEKGQIVDSSIVLPKGPKYVYYNSSFLLKFIKPETRKVMNQDMENKKPSVKVKVFTKIRSIVLKSYGPFGYSQAWINKVVAHFKDDKEYDLVLSLSSPVTSHIAANHLIKKGRVKCKKFCELWEDPWQYDIYKEKIDKKLLDLEYKITQYPDKVLYVSPITAKIQSEIFVKSSSKMDWVVLPYYYKDEKQDICYNKYVYGYFGDYFPQSRNLCPFYEVAKKNELEVNICGMPNSLFASTDSIHIHPRLPLDELKEFEDVTNVLVFVCNLRGGQIPGKIYQYSATNKKILFILDGTEEEVRIIHEFYKKFKRYYFCENTIESIEKAIAEIENENSCDIVNRCVDEFSPKNVCRMILNKCFGEKYISFYNNKY